MSLKQDYILIADSGSTKTEWGLLKNDGSIINLIEDEGINPMTQDRDHIIKTIDNLEKQISQYGEPQRIYFYGAGCIKGKPSEMLKNIISLKWIKASIEIHSDMFGAARALSGNEAGIVCILGTGSNSCCYNGQDIIAQVPSLGYVLGDEGSGNALGKRWLNTILKKPALVPSHLLKKYYRNYPSLEETLINVYKKPGANYFLASVAVFLSRHRDANIVRQIIKEEFDLFFRNNILQYKDALSYEISFTGSIAYYFSDFLKESANSFGLKIKKISHRPLKGLIEYHKNNLL